MAQPTEWNKLKSWERKKVKDFVGKHKLIQKEYNSARALKSAWKGLKPSEKGEILGIVGMGIGGIVGFSSGMSKANELLPKIPDLAYREGITAGEVVEWGGKNMARATNSWRYTMPSTALGAIGGAISGYGVGKSWDKLARKAERFYYKKKK